MNYQDILTNARTCIGPYCKACPVCNGRACGAQMPGPGAKGVGDTAIRNYDAWKRIRINMDDLGILGIDTFVAGGPIGTPNPDC